MEPTSLGSRVGTPLWDPAVLAYWPREMPPRCQLQETREGQSPLLPSPGPFPGGSAYTGQPIAVLEVSTVLSRPEIPMYRRGATSDVTQVGRPRVEVMARIQRLPPPHRLWRMWAQRTNMCKSACRQDGSHGCGGDFCFTRLRDAHVPCITRGPQSSVKLNVNNQLMT